METAEQVGCTVGVEARLVVEIFCRHCWYWQSLEHTADTDCCNGGEGPEVLVVSLDTDTVSGASRGKVGARTAGPPM